jgi:hypothetical protein
VRHQLRDDLNYPYGSCEFPDSSDYNLNLTAGYYYFTVQTIGTDGEADSKVVYSDTWEYEAPSDALDVSTPVLYEDGTFTWENSFSDKYANLVDYYEVYIYCRATEDDQLERRWSLEYTPDELNGTLSLNYLRSELGAGYYAIVVQAFSKDINQVRTGAESNWSNIVYLEALSQDEDATISLDERLIVDTPTVDESSYLLSWALTEPSQAGLVDHYWLTIYRSNEACEHTGDKVTSIWDYNADSLSLAYWLQDYGTGYYYCTVQAVGSDADQEITGPESAPSEVFHYIAPPQLDAPTILGWGKRVAITTDEDSDAWIYSLEDCPGAVYWNCTATTPTEYMADIYRVMDDGEDEFITTCVVGCIGSADEHYEGTDLTGLGLEEGETYYFTVYARGDNVQNSNSDAVKSDTWTYPTPDVQLAAPTSLTWSDRTITWAESSNEYLYGYVVRIYWRSTEEVEPKGKEWHYEYDSDLTFFTVYDFIISRYGAGYYSIQVMARSKDLSAISNSEWSAMSTAIYVSSTTLTLQNISQNLQDDSSDDGVQAAIDEVKNLDGLKEVLEQDVNNGEAAALIQQLEEMAGVKSDVTSSVADIDANNVSVIGAGLNASDDGEKVTLKIDSASREVDTEGLKDAVSFSMELDGAGKENTETGHQKLDVPVVITLPVPASINPAFLVIRHYNENDSEHPYDDITPYVYSDNGQWYARFVVDSFSDFTMGSVELQAEKTESGVSVTVQLSNTESMEQAFCAVYDEGGKQLGIAKLTSSGTATVPCDATQASKVKVFVLDSNYGPVSKAAEITINETTNNKN